MDDLPAHYGGLRILVAEDDFFIIEDCVHTLAAMGIDVIGPVSSLKEATRLVNEAGRLDGAILDVSLRGEMVYPLADALIAEGVPVVFATGYKKSDLPERYRSIVHCSKPVDARAALDVLLAGRAR
jgi:CheY-like chemotaxis protein